ncbi:Sec-independent protein translocase subunit TatA/TatB [Planctomicrobium sp. SH668]|uniref:Sec-independent protein translocase subunit TatA/TatB n=1 Tax=Planctomicrobium sp. SH668 TaxID=3448126 RepID=UPI003F5C405D
MFGLGVPEMVIIAVIVIVLFGSRIPSAMRSLGGSFSEFKKGLKEGEDEDEKLEK